MLLVVLLIILSTFKSHLLHLFIISIPALNNARSIGLTVPTGVDTLLGVANAVGVVMLVEVGVFGLFSCWDKGLVLPISGGLSEVVFNLLHWMPFFSSKDSLSAVVFLSCLSIFNNTSAQKYK